MGLVEADLGPGVRVSMAAIGLFSHAPLENQCLEPFREPLALEGWVLEILC